MGRPKGMAKTGGRKAGTPNRKSMALVERCEAMGIDPFEEMLKMANDPMLVDPHLRFNALKELCQYLYPKRKSIDINADVDWDIIERAKELSAMSDEELRAIVNNTAGSRHDFNQAPK